MRHDTTTGDAPEQIPADLVPSGINGLVSQSEETGAMSPMRHSASYKSLHTQDLQNIIPRRRPPNKWIPNFTEQQQAEFWALVDRRGPNECWPWKGAKAPAHRYSPHILYGTWKKFKAHRVAYRIAVGPIPDNHTVDHVRNRGCTDTLCCNPAHLEPITQTEQVERRDADKIIAPGFSLCKYGHVRPRGRKAHCAECARRFGKEAQRKWREKERTPEEWAEIRATRNANRRRQRAAVKARQSEAQ